MLFDLLFFLLPVHYLHQLSVSVCRSLSHPQWSPKSISFHHVCLCLLYGDILCSVKSVTFLRSTAIKQCLSLPPPSSLSLSLSSSIQRINPFICSCHPLGRVLVPSSFILSFMSFLSPVLAAAVCVIFSKTLLALQSYQFFYSVYSRTWLT